MKKFGFTLAEVLITLGVIGVVAAITMPTLIQHHQKQATVTQLKKAYSEFAQALQKAEAEHGLMETWDFADFNNALERGTYFTENYILPHIKTIKKCIPTSNECWADDVKNLSGNKTSDNYFTNRKPDFVSFVTASGYSVYIWLHGNGTGMWYVVDINGLKGPNKLGRDIFALEANWGKTQYKRGIYPAGIELAQTVTRENMIDANLPLANVAYKCKKENSTLYIGVYCAAVIMLDGWKITDTYPW